MATPPKRGAGWLDIRTYAYTGKGGRRNNEDYYGYYWEGDAGCWAVADGLGGHSSGEVASRFVTEAVIGKAGAWPSFSDEAVISMVEGINESLLREQSLSPAYKGMKSTIVAVFAENGVLKHIHAGDSRFYYFRGGSIHARTKDHSLSQKAVDSGEIDYEDIRFHEDRNIVLKVLGIANLNLAGMAGTIIPEPGDAFLLCTDGLCGIMSDNDIENILMNNTGDIKQSLNVLLSESEKIGWQDNVTIALCLIESGSEKAAKKKKWKKRPVSKRKFKKMLLFTFLAAILLTGLAVGSWYFFVEKKMETPCVQMNDGNGNETPGLEDGTTIQEEIKQAKDTIN